MQLAAMIFAALVGASLAVQIGLNSMARVQLGHPVTAAIANFAVGIVCLLAFAIVARAPVPALAQVSSAPPWLWLGGLLGALYVGSGIVLGPQLGGAMFMALTVTGQLLAALVLDHYGLLGFPVRPVDLGRIVGVSLVIAGVIVLARQ
jgi:transporter family-2 protein